MIQHCDRCFSLLTSLYSLLAFGRSGLFGPPLCGGSAPATPPLLQPRVVASVWAIRSCRPVSARAFPSLLTDSDYVPAQPRQARPLPYMPNVHRDDHREPATEMQTVHSSQADRTQNMLSSYAFSSRRSSAQTGLLVKLTRTGFRENANSLALSRCFGTLGSAPGFMYRPQRLFRWVLRRFERDRSAFLFGPPLDDRPPEPFPTICLSA